MQEHHCKCGDCIFWDRAGEREGLCRRHAPAPSHGLDETANWPETYVDNGCGEGMAGAAPGRVACTDCIFWDRPQNGLDPTRRWDKTADWWRHAGHCARYAPQASPEPGARAYWRATSERDSCGDGKPR